MPNIKDKRKSLDNLSKKLYKVESKSMKLHYHNQNKTGLFPNLMLQERHNNFIPYYLVWYNFIKKLKEELKPLDTNFVVLPL